jgi:hypothetical protein
MRFAADPGEVSGNFPFEIGHRRVGGGARAGSYWLLHCNHAERDPREGMSFAGKAVTEMLPAGNRSLWLVAPPAMCGGNVRIFSFCVTGYSESR